MTPLELAGAVVLVGTALGTLGGLWRYVLRPMLRLFRKVEAVADAWNGEPARDGLPSRPGVIDRLITIERDIKVNGTGLPLGEAMAKTLRDTEDLKTGQVAARQAAEKALVVAAEVDIRLTKWVEESLVREITYKDSLVELGIDVDPPRPEGGSS